MTSSDQLIQQARSSVEVTPSAPRRRVAVVTCIDTRLDPLAMYGARIGDLHVIRNAGGLVNGDVMRSLLISQVRTGTTSIDLVMHTDCAVQGLSDDDMRGELGNSNLKFGGFENLDETVRQGVATLRGSEILPHRDRIAGYVYDVSSRSMHRVAE